MNIPGGELTIDEAAIAAFLHWNSKRIQDGLSAIPWDEMAPEVRAAWKEAQALAGELVLVAMIHDFEAWAKGQGDLGAAIAAAMERYAKTELDYNPQGEFEECYE